MLDQTLQKHLVVVCNDNDQETNAIINSFKAASAAQLTIEQADSGTGLMSLLHRLCGKRYFPNIIILDFLLGDCNACTIAPELRKNFPPVPLVVLGSCLGTEKEITTLYRQGVNAYMVKPQSMQEYKELVGHIEKLWLDVPQPIWSDRVDILYDEGVERRFYGRRIGDRGG